MVKRANEAVEAATEKIRQLKRELFERGLKIEDLSGQLVAAEVEVEQTRDKATKLEERFTQVRKRRCTDGVLFCPQSHLHFVILFPVLNKTSLTLANRAYHDDHRRLLRNAWMR